MVRGVRGAGPRCAGSNVVTSPARSLAPRRWSEEESSSVRAGSREQAQQDDPNAFDPLAPAASFRVYTPAEMRSAPLRPSNRPSPARGLGDALHEGIAQAEAAGPRALLKWLGIGVAIGSLLLTAFVLLMNLTDDTRAAPRSTKAHSTMSADDRWTPSLRLPATATKTPAVTQAPATDFEIPDDAPAQTGAGRTAKSRAAAKPAGKPKATVRRAPF